MAEKTRKKWEIGRLFQTLNYFEIIPFISCLQRLFKKNKPNQKKMEKILVAGATGGVGKRVVNLLLENNYEVRALVRDSKRAKEILGKNADKVELFEANIVIPETLTPELMKGISAIICCTGTKVQPKEGDTPNREKYYQGIKFYEPEVVDIPEKVEYEGIKNLVQIAAKTLRKGEKILFDFTNPTQDVKETWGALNDVVMGGVSESNMKLIPNRALFSGNVSTENNGGFASVRSRNFAPALDLSEYEGIELRIQGDGKRYKFISRCEGKWDGISYCYSFDTMHNCWLTVRIPWRDLIPVFRAKTVWSEGKFDPSKVYSMQLMLSKFEYDGALNPKFSTGKFGLEIEYLKAYGGKHKPQFIMISSAGVTRPGRKDLNLEEEPPAVRMNDQLGGILTWKLEGENALRDSGLNYTIIRPCALTEKPGDKALIWDQGDKIKGQVSRDAIAALCLQAMEKPEACNKTFEVKEEEQQGKTNWDTFFTNLQID